MSDSFDFLEIYKKVLVAASKGDNPFGAIKDDVDRDKTEVTGIYQESGTETFQDISAADFEKFVSALDRLLERDADTDILL